MPHELTKRVTRGGTWPGHVPMPAQGQPPEGGSRAQPTESGPPTGAPFTRHPADGTCAIPNGRQGGLKPPVKTPPSPKSLVNAPSEPRGQASPAEPGGVLTASSVSPVMVDGGTRFALREEWTPCAPFAALLGDLRQPRTREQDREDRAAGGRVVRLPMMQRDLFEGDQVAAEVTVSGTRRETITLYVPDLVHIRLFVERQEVAVQLKARGLWSEGYARIADRWLGTILWWVTGEECSLADAHRRGWVTTGAEICADFVGLRFTADDRHAFVGFSKSQLIRQVDKGDELATLQIGNRTNPVSLCIYDKDSQIEEAKGGDDSTYRETHRRHGWDGESQRRRVEWRLSGRGLEFVNHEGVVLDMRDPATLADQTKLDQVWAVLCAKKRLIETGSSTRRERCAVDERWSVVAAVVDKPAVSSEWRQLRIPQADAHEEAVRRSRRDALRALDRVAALHGSDASPTASALYVVSTMTDAEKRTSAEYRRRYAAKRSPYMGPEMRSARPRFDIVVGAAVSGSAPSLPNLETDCKRKKPDGGPFLPPGVNRM